MSGGETLHSGSDYDRTANVSGPHTLAWLERTHCDAGKRAAFERARKAIRSALEAKGIAMGARSKPPISRWTSPSAHISA
jgi:hypothetical protein